MHTLFVNFADGYTLDLNKSKKVWNFVKGDIEKLLSVPQFDANLTISKNENSSFNIDYQGSKKNDNLEIDSSLKFAKSLTLTTDDDNFSALILAIMMRLQRLYKRAFSIKCDYYPIVSKARVLLKDVLGLQVTNNWLSEFVDSPMPGKKPNKGKALKSNEIVRRSENKKRNSGKVRVSTWMNKDVRSQLTSYCEFKGLTLEKALSEIIPLGLNIRAYINKENTENGNKAV